MIRLGGRVHTMAVAFADLWKWAAPGRSLSEYFDHAAKMELENQDEVLDYLIDNGLWVHHGATVQVNGPLLKSHRLVPVGIGAGSVEPGGAVYAIATHEGRPLLDLDYGLYNVWASSYECKSLAAVCYEVAQSTGIPAGDLLSRTAKALPLLIGNAAGFLDRVT